MCATQGLNLLGLTGSWRGMLWCAMVKFSNFRAGVYSWWAILRPFISRKSCSSGAFLFFIFYLEVLIPAAFIRGSPLVTPSRPSSREVFVGSHLSFASLNPPPTPSSNPVIRTRTFQQHALLYTRRRCGHRPIRQCPWRYGTAQDCWYQHA